MTDVKTAPLLHWLLEQFPDTPKSRAKDWIVAGRVSVNGVVIRKPHQVIPPPGDALELGGRRASTLDCGSGWQIHPRVTLLHLDSSLAVVNKGPGLISVPAPNAEISALSILADFLAGRLKAQDRKVAAKNLPPSYRRLELSPVHRIDQYTTGVFCIATNPEARQKLIAQFSAHTVKRQYVAFVEGSLPAAKGTWRNWLQPSRDQLRQHIISESQAKSAGDDVREAITHYEVIAEYPLSKGQGAISKIQLRLETGRKHQIRAQAAHAGVPLIGDRVYNPAYRGHEAVKPTIEFDRQALHAEFLELEQPAQPGKQMSWKAELPKDMRQLEGALRAKTV
jgi:23S rRNA pseudouridine1911/1915/1917 synthase